MQKTDLHCHSTFSDGVLAPEVLVARAQDLGVRLLALTDHDTFAGVAAAQTAAGNAGALEVVSGIELSANWRGLTIHVLGYGFALDAGSLLEIQDRLHEGRWIRAREIDRRLAAKGMPGALEGACAVQAELGVAPNAPARPHFAEFLLRAGHVRDRSEAFSRWLGAGKLGDVRQHWPELSEVMDCLRAARAWISLAHPCQYALTRTKRRALVSAFVEQGGHALEVCNGLQAHDQVGVLARLARDFDLRISGGSDFHAPGDWSELGLYRDLPESMPSLAELLAHNERPPITRQGAA